LGRITWWKIYLVLQYIAIAVCSIVSFHPVCEWIWYCCCSLNIKFLEEYMTPPHFNFAMTNEMHTPPPFYGHFSGTTWMSWCQNTISGLLWCKGGNRGRHTTIRMSATPSGLIGDPPPTSPLVFTLDALPAASLSLYPGLGQAPSMLVCIPSGMVNEMHTMWYYWSISVPVIVFCWFLCIFTSPFRNKSKILVIFNFVNSDCCISLNIISAKCYNYYFLHDERVLQSKTFGLSACVV